MMVSYLLKNRSCPSSASKIPSVISLTTDLAVPCSLKRILKLTVSPSGSPSSSAIRLATLRAASRLGWVWPIWPVTPRPASIASFGNCVVLPEPVSPATIITWWSWIAWMISSLRLLTGNSAFKVSGKLAGMLSIRSCTTCCERALTFSKVACFSAKALGLAFLEGRVSSRCRRLKKWRSLANTGNSSIFFAADKSLVAVTAISDAVWGALLSFVIYFLALLAIL